jgi:Na+/H+ antiporter
MNLSISALVFWALLALLVFAVVSRILHKPYPIVMLAGGASIALIPGLPPIVLAPDLVFLVMLPLLLFGGGWATDFRRFKQFLSPILLLALGLVVVTTLCVAALAHAWMGLPLASAFVLGAVLSPSDAIATEAIAEEIEFPQATAAILSGESLVNDAAALVIYAFAVEAVVRGTFEWGPALLDLFYVSIAGLAIGIGVSVLMYFLSIALRRANLSDELMGVLLSLVTPFLTYLPAEAAQASGVLAAVSGGVFLSSKSGDIFSAEERIAAGSVWQTVVFALNGLAFILVGLQLRSILAELSVYPAGTLIAYALGSAALIVAVRIALVMAGGYLRWMVRKAKGRRVYDRPAWGEFFITSWSGIRGIVTLAGALAIPLTTSAGAPFPGRALILYLAFTTIVITLVGQGLTLPFIVRKMPSPDDYEFAKDVANAQYRVAGAAREHLRELEAGFTTTQEWEAATRLIGMLDQRMLEAKAKLAGGSERESAAAVASSDRVLRLEVTTSEREELEKLRRSGEISERAFRHVQWEIDLLESMLKQS